MDIFSHGLWTLTMFYRKPYRWYAALIGIAPDLISFGPHFVYSMLFNSFRFGSPDISTLPAYIFTLYNLSHSFIVFLAAAAVAYILTNKLPWIMAGWGIHVLVDIPTHTERFFPTPFLFPLSSLKFSGISWGTPWFLLADYIVLLLVFIYLIFGSRIKKKICSGYRNS